MANAGSSIHLDPDVLNAVLQQFVNRPEGPRVTFQDGRFIVNMGAFTASVDDIHIGPQGIDLHLSVVRPC